MHSAENELDCVLHYSLPLTAVQALPSLLQFKSPSEILRETIEMLFATGHINCLAAHPGMSELSKNFIKVKAAFPDIKTELKKQLMDGD